MRKIDHKQLASVYYPIMADYKTGMSITDLAAIYGVPLTTVHNWVKQKATPRYVKSGKVQPELINMGDGIIKPFDNTLKTKTVSPQTVQLRVETTYTTEKETAERKHNKRMQFAFGLAAIIICAIIPAIIVYLHMR